MSNFSAAPIQPFEICALSPSALLYLDQWQFPPLVNWLDCSTENLKTGQTTVRIQEDTIHGMCCASEDEKPMLITTQGATGIYCHDLNSGTLEWSAKGKLTGMVRTMNLLGVTTDGRGHLFVCDTSNNCIQMFDTDGKYIGVLLKKGVQDLGSPHLICYSQHLSSLVVTQTTNAFKSYHIIVISLHHK